jgi:hypothetical protein
VFSYGKYKKRCCSPNSLKDKEKAIRRGDWLVQFGSST